MGYLITEDVIDEVPDITLTSDPAVFNEKIICSYQFAPPNPDIYIKTFGGFGVYVNGSSLYFPRRRSKEILAVLLDHRGAVLTNSTIISTIWQDECNSPKVKMQFMKAFQILKNTLADAGISDILINDRNSKGINISKIRCDYLDAMEDTSFLLKNYHCDYLPDYSWAEETNGFLYQLYLTAVPEKDLLEL